MQNIHNPIRLDGETQLAYRHRQKVSKALAGRGELLAGHRASPERRARRAMNRLYGARAVRKGNFPLAAP